MSRIFAALAAAAYAAFSLTFAGPALAQRSEVVRFVVPYAPGGPGDQIARLLASEVARIQGNSIIVENKPGAGGIIAAEHVAKSSADGRTFLVGSNAALVINTALYPKLPYNPEKDFVPVGSFAKTPLLLVVRKDLPANNVPQLIALGKTAGGKLNMGSSGNGSITHLAGEYASGLMGFKVTHAPFAGSAPAITSLMGGNIDIMFDALPSSLQQARAGKIKPLAIMDSKRLAALPDVPTMRELGYENVEASAWFGLVAPAGTARDTIEKLNKAINEALAKPELQSKLAGIGAEPMPGTPAQFDAFIKSEFKRWIPVVKSTGVTVD